jgi:hypothetical protein
MYYRYGPYPYINNYPYNRDCCINRYRYDCNYPIWSSNLYDRSYYNDYNNNYYGSYY